ncbi:dehydrogenase reductase SDR family member 13-like protein [Labeo rohita]|uniref:Dehydrogenase reductase SDR family member 13-like protein n=1 Tax=Labeo rohita TaxID=84645 RepID=A0A498M670_LABRO|nr:dehydrogenase reductase SDR family member 13-like protein [Labeo rohita]
MFTVLLICGGLVAFYLLLYVTVLRLPKCQSTTKLHGKTVIVTGANTGIGKATALDLAKRGARVILACRDESRAQAAVTDIQRESGNKEVLYMHLDLASLKSVRSFAENFLKKESRLDILISNAGGNTGIGKATALDLAGRGVRVILACRNQKKAEAAINDIKKATGSNDILFMELDLGSLKSVRAFVENFLKSESRLDLLINNAGIVKTELSRHVSLWQKVFIEPVARLLFLDPKTGAQTTLHCAVQEGIEHLSGRYFSCCAVEEVGAKAKDDAVAKKLWEVSERLSGLS